MPNELNRERLAKLLALTQKDNEHEIVGAIRKCNQMLAEADMTWEQVLAPARGITVTVTRTPAHRYGFQTEAAPPSEDWVAPHLKDEVMISMMFRAVYAAPRSSNEEFWQFMDNIHHHWQQQKQLTVGQYRALRNVYQRTLKTSRQ